MLDDVSDRLRILFNGKNKRIQTFKPVATSSADILTDDDSDKSVATVYQPIAGSRNSIEPI